MEDLNKNQIVLLTLLVSFVTSIATGIVTVTLMDQAPAGVTQTINQVIERTIERVVPAETQTTTVIREVPVVVTEAEQVVKAVADASPALVRLVLVDDPNAVPIAFGFITGDSGLIISSEPVWPITEPAIAPKARSSSTAEPKPDLNHLRALLPDGRALAIKSVSTNILTGLGSVLTLGEIGRGVAAWQIDLPASEVTTLPHVDMSLDQLVIGQRVLALGLDRAGRTLVEDGIVSGGPALSMSDMATTTATTTSSATGDQADEAAPEAFLIITDAVTGANVGGPLLNLNGRVVGLSLAPGKALPSATVLALLAATVNDAGR